MSTRTSLLLIAVIFGAAAVAEAKDAYFDIAVRDLKLVEGKLPAASAPVGWRHYDRMPATQPYAVLDGPGEAYLGGLGPNGRDASPYAAPVESPDYSVDPAATMSLHIRAPEGHEVKGRLVLVNASHSGMIVLRFVVPSERAKDDAKATFFMTKAWYYNHLLDRDLPGGAWFRHEVRLCDMELNAMPTAAQGRPIPPRARPEGFADTYELFSGGRAISENLQLDRALPTRAANDTPVKVSTIEGITIKEIDWKPRLKDAQPALDPLAGKIPFDQHAVFFPSFAAAVAVADEAQKHDTPVLHLAEPRSEDTGVVQRYERQLGLSLSGLARHLGPLAVKSAALTGGDISYPLGTDVAVLLETSHPEAVAKVLGARVATSAKDLKDVTAERGEADGLSYFSVVSGDRKLSNYVAQLDGAVVVTNSLYQLKRLAAVSNGKEKSLADLPEYKFFRIRYPRGEADESALIFLSDATIRRWCGPQWRIADSRRTRARAVLAELQASQAEAIVAGKVEPGPLHTDLPILGGGEVRLTPDGVRSSVYGTLDFMTPVGELAMDEVNKDEADSYAQWRDGYQRNWTWTFDPIGLRIGLDKRKLSADLTIMPLIVNSEYDQFLEISKGANFAPQAGDPHQALAQFILALNHDSYLFHLGEGLLQRGSAGKNFSLGWIGSSISAYADDDPFWDDLAKVTAKTDEKEGDERRVNDFITKNLGRLPVAVRIESVSPLQLAAFLATARTYVEQTGPGLTRWDSLKYKEQGYVRISPVKGQQGVTPEMENVAVYYTTVGGALTITWSENVLKHAIDRGLIAKPQAAGASLPASRFNWLGSNVALHVDRRIVELASAAGQDQYQDHMQVLSWSNLPILNEWKRLFPDRDPVAVHRELWGVTLVCPGGGKYVWNERYGTMESTVYGHPGQPKAGPPAPPVLSTFASADFGLTLENDGLRAKVELKRPAK